jgi:hypothetical protein
MDYKFKYSALIPQPATATHHRRNTTAAAPPPQLHRTFAFINRFNRLSGQICYNHLKNPQSYALLMSLIDISALTFFVGVRLAHSTDNHKKSPV